MAPEIKTDIGWRIAAAGKIRLIYFIQSSIHFLISILFSPCTTTTPSQDLGASDNRK
jgi:hypothetical protein